MTRRQRVAVARFRARKGPARFPVSGPKHHEREKERYRIAYAHAEQGIVEALKRCGVSRALNAGGRAEAQAVMDLPAGWPKVAAMLSLARRFDALAAVPVKHWAQR